MMDTINDPRIESLAIMTSAQIGKTELVLNVIGYFIQHDPSPMLLCQPTLDLAKAFSKDRLAPMVRDTPALRGKISDAKSRDGDNTLLHKSFPGGHITMGGANSPASLASRPIRITLLDEVDRYPKSAGSEGDPVKLAEKRTTTFWNRKKIKVSTPTIDGESRIQTEWDLSDQRRYHVPCPDCGHRQHLEWEQVKWGVDEGGNLDPRSVVYICKDCGVGISDKHKQSMLLAGEWIADFPGRKVAGFHLNELYSPWKRWHEVVEDFLEAKDDPERMKVWVNTSLGLPYAVKSEDTPDWKRLYDRREDYPIGTVTSRACLLTAAADVQKDRLECKVMGWNRKESWVIDVIVVLGDTSTLTPYEELENQLFHRPWLHENGSSLEIEKLAIDTGFNTTTVYEWVRTQNPRRVMAVKGMPKLDTALGKPRMMDVNSRGKTIKRGLRLWGVGVNVLKPDLYARLKKEKPTDAELEEKGYPKSYIHFPMLGEDYFKQLTAEEMKAVPQKGGGVRYEWVKLYPSNEALDLGVYNIAAFHALGAHKWNDDEWVAREARLGIKETRSEPKPERPQPIAPTPAAAGAEPSQAQRPSKRRSSIW